MEMIIAGQVVVMFLLICLGIFCTKMGMLDENSSRPFINFLLMAVAPAITIKQFLRPSDPSLLLRTALAFGLAILFHLLSIGLGLLLIPRRESDHYSSERIAASYSNAGFMALPLLEASLGEEGLLFGIVYMATFTIFNWTYCDCEISGRRTINLKKLLLNPAILGIATGILFFIFGVTLPSIAVTTLTHIANLNTPLSMIIIGVFLAGVHPRQLLGDRHMLWAVALRNLIYPLLFVVLLWISGAAGWMDGGRNVVFASIISAACPSAVVVILMSSREDRCDPRYGASLVALSTLLSIATLPLVIAVANALL